MPKPKVHRFRSDCEKDMLKMVLKKIGETEPDIKSGDYLGDISYEYTRYGIHVRMRITWPEDCKVCGCTARRLDMKYGRNW